MHNFVKSQFSVHIFGFLLVHRQENNYGLSHCVVVVQFFVSKMMGYNLTVNVVSSIFGAHDGLSLSWPNLFVSLTTIEVNVWMAGWLDAHYFFVGINDFQA